MDAGTGIGGFSKNREELVETKFDLFSKVPLETGVKKIIPQRQGENKTQTTY